MMHNLTLDSEPFIRIGFFVGILIIMALWETAIPRRPLTYRKTVRWFNNLSLIFVDTVALRYLFPITAAGTAMFVESHN